MAIYLNPLGGYTYVSEICKRRKYVCQVHYLQATAILNGPPATTSTSTRLHHLLTVVEATCRVMGACGLVNDMPTTTERRRPTQVGACRRCSVAAKAC